MHDQDIEVLIWNMKVVPDQRHKFDTDPFFVTMANTLEVNYTSLPHAPEAERRHRFLMDCREGMIPIAVLPSGFNLELHARLRPSVTPTAQSRARSSTDNHSYIEMDNGTQARICSIMILNGVCIRWKGTIDKHSLIGRGKIEFDEERAQEETELMNDMHMLDELNRQLDHHLSTVVTSTQTPLAAAVQLTPVTTSSS